MPLSIVYYSFFSPQDKKSIDKDCRSAKIGCVDCKSNVLGKIKKDLKPFREKKDELTSQPPSLFKKIFDQGNKMAQETAHETLKLVKTNMRLNTDYLLIMNQTLFLKEENSNAFLVTFSTREGDSKTGHLDLLWSLIKNYEVNIQDVCLSRITNDYIQYLREHEISLRERSSFTNMAARLLLYKSEKNLPYQESTEKENPFDRLPPELIENLLEYKKLQIAAGRLESFRSASEQTLPKEPEWGKYADSIDFLKGGSDIFFEGFPTIPEQR